MLLTEIALQWEVKQSISVSPIVNFFAESTVDTKFKYFETYYLNVYNAVGIYLHGCSI